MRVLDVGLAVGKACSAGGPIGSSGPDCWAARLATPSGSGTRTRPKATVCSVCVLAASAGRD